IQVLAADGAESPALLPAETLHGDRHHELLPDEGAQIDPVVLKKLYLVVLIGDRLHPFGHPALFLVPVAAARPGDELLLKVGLHLGRVGAEAAAAEQGDGNGDPPLHQDAIPGAGRPTLNVDRPAAGLHANLGQIWRAGLIGDEDLCPAPLPQQPADLQLHGRSPPHYTGFPSTPSRETPEHPAPVWRPPGAHKEGDAATAHEPTERRRARPVTSPSHTLPSRRVAYATAAGGVRLSGTVVPLPRAAFEAPRYGRRLWLGVALPSPRPPERLRCLPRRPPSLVRGGPPVAPPFLRHGPGADGVGGGPLPGGLPGALDAPPLPPPRHRRLCGGYGVGLRVPSGGQGDGG